MAILLFPAMLAVWCWRSARRPHPLGGLRLSMILLSAMAAVFQLVWLNLLVISPMAGTGQARHPVSEQLMDNGLAETEAQATVEAASAADLPAPEPTQPPRTSPTGASQTPSPATTATVATTTTVATTAATVATTATVVATTTTRRQDPEPSSGGSGGLSLVLEVAEESDGGVAYDRDLYGSWTQVSAGCNTRCAVLGEERRSDGTWLSWYDGRSISDSSDLDIDHMVPLAEAHSSGGWQWSSAHKRRFANDIDHPQALAAVSASSNRSKGARDPAEWKPPDRTAWCRYASDWITVKAVWNLTADPAEIRGLEQMVGTCDQPVTITTVPASRAGGTAATSTTITASGPCPYTSTAGDPCGAVPELANRLNDVNCGDVPSRYRPLTVVGTDYDRLDGNRDGEACS